MRSQRAVWVEKRKVSIVAATMPNDLYGLDYNITAQSSGAKPIYHIG